MFKYTLFGICVQLFTIYNSLNLTIRWRCFQNNVYTFDCTCWLTTIDTFNIVTQLVRLELKMHYAASAVLTSTVWTPTMLPSMLQMQGRRRTFRLTPRRWMILLWALVLQEQLGWHLAEVMGSRSTSAQRLVTLDGSPSQIGLRLHAYTQAMRRCDADSQSMQANPQAWANNSTLQWVAHWGSWQRGY